MMYAAHKTPEINHIYERNNEATLYIANLDAQVDEETLCELFMQCGNVKNVHIPRDKVNGSHSGYGFVEYEYEYECDYAARILNMTKLYGKPLRCNKASQDKKMFDVGANLFIGNLDKEVDEKMLFDIFSAFGQVTSVRVIRNEDDVSKGHGFVSYDNFESSDMAIENMNNQFISNKKVHVSYAYKKDTKGERHGTAAERFIAANKAMNMYSASETAAHVNSNVTNDAMNNHHTIMHTNPTNNPMNHPVSTNHATLPPPPPPPMSAPNMIVPNRFNMHNNANNNEMYMNNNYVQSNNTMSKMGNEALPPLPPMGPMGPMSPMGPLSSIESPGNVYYSPNVNQQAPSNFGIPTQFTNMRQPNMYKMPLPPNQNMENRMYPTYPSNMPSNMPPNMISNIPPNIIPPPNMLSGNMMGPNIAPHFVHNTYSSNYVPNYPPNYSSHYPPNFESSGMSNMGPSYVPNLPPNMPPNIPPNMPHNIPPNLPSHIGIPNMPMNIPPNLPPNMPPNMPPNLPPNMPPNIPPNMPPNMPPNLPPSMPAGAPPNIPPTPSSFGNVASQVQQNNKPGNETYTNVSEGTVTETTSSTSQLLVTESTVDNVQR